MKYRTHIAGGLALGYVVYNNMNFSFANIDNKSSFFIATAGLLVGSLISDIDTKKSYASNKAKPISFITSKLLKHRGYTHSIVGTLSMTLIVYFLLEYFGLKSNAINLFSISFMLGMISHILLDMFNPTGVELFYPFTDKRQMFLKKGIATTYNFSFKEFLVFASLLFIAYKNVSLLI